jgi:hypothetical protein
MAILVNTARIAVPRADAFPDEGDDQPETALITGHLSSPGHHRRLAPTAQSS